MNANQVNVAVVDGKTITESVELRNTLQGVPVRIKAVQDGKYILNEGTDKPVAPENITIKRVGNDLHVATEGTSPDQPQLIIEGFFESQGQLVGIAEDGAYYEYISSDGEQDHGAAFLHDGVSSPQVLGSQELVGFGNGLVAGGGIGWFWPALLGLGALGLLGAAYAIVKHNDDDDNHHDSGIVLPTPELGDATDNVGDKQGSINKGDSTDDKTPTFTGTGTPGNHIIIEDGGKPIGEVTIGDDGKWEFTPDKPLDDGKHSIVVIEKDPDGNTSKPTDEFDFVVDTVAPGKSVIGSIVDDFGDEQGIVNQNDRTDDTTPTLKGTAEAGATLEIWANGEKIGETLVDKDGNWSFTPKDPMADGRYDFTTVAVDAAGNKGLPSDSYIIIVDSNAGNPPVKPEVGTGGIENANDNVGPITGDIGNGGVTDDNTPTFSGGGLLPGDKVTIKDGDKVIGEVIVGDDGKWEYTPDPALDDGEHPITVIITNPAGQDSEPSDPYIVIVDTEAPVKPGIGTGGIEDAIDNVGPISGDIGNGGTTDDNTPTFGGGGLQPGDIVTIKDGDDVIGEVVVGDDGKWEYTPDPALADGSHPIVVIVTDPAGNASEPSDPYIVIIDTTAPGAPRIDNVFDDQGSSTGNLNPGDVTDDAQPDITGTAEAGSLVIIYDNGIEIGRETADEYGKWSHTPKTPLLNGGHSLTAAAQDIAGNISAPSNEFDFDLLAGGMPPVAAITGVIDDVEGGIGNIMPGGLTNDATPEVQGTSAPFSVVSVFLNGQLHGTATANAQGVWTYPIAPALADGNHLITASATDAVGNNGPVTGGYEIIIDTVAPAAPLVDDFIDNVGPITGDITDGTTTDDSTPTFTGHAEPNGVVIIFDKGVEIGRAPVNDQGEWTYTPAPALADGDYEFSTVAEDAAGNRSPASTPIGFVVDTSGVVISIDEVTDNVGPIQDPLTSGSVTDDTTPTLSGKATPGTTVNIYLNGVLLQAGIQVDGLGNWVYTVSPALPEGDHTFNASATSPVTGESEQTADFDLVIDTTASAPPTIGNVVDDVGAITGTIDDGDDTDDSTPSLSGTGVFGDIILIRDNGNVIGTAPVQQDGSWSYTPSTPLNEGTHQFDVIAQDAAGNQSAPSAPWAVNVDTTAPTASAVVESMGKDSGADSTDFATNDGSAGRLIQGTLSAALVAGEKVQVSTDGGATWLDALLNGNGTWSFLDQNSHSGNWTIQTRVMDAAGNANTTSQAVKFDGTAPDAPSEFSIDGTVVTVTFDGSTLGEGDIIQVVVGGERYEQPLTQAQIDAGSVDVPVLAGATMGSTSAAFIDSAGNVSQYLSLNSGIIEADFNGLTSGTVDPGSAIKLDGFTFQFNSIYNASSFQNNGVFGPDHWHVSLGRVPSSTGLGIRYGGGVGEATRLILDDGETATNFKFDWGVSATALQLRFYDIDGNLVHTSEMNQPSITDFLIKFETEMPDGIAFHSVEFLPLKGSAEEGWLFADNFEITTRSGGGFEHKDPAVSQEVDASGSYLGGNADNVFTVSDVASLDDTHILINGGAGVDTLSLSGMDQLLDLGAIAGKLESIEIIDITGTGNNTLNISLGDILENGESSLFSNDESQQMMIKGNAGDVVNLDDLLADGTDAGDWSTEGQVTVEGIIYNVFQYSTLDAQLLVQEGVTTNLV